MTSTNLDTLRETLAHEIGHEVSGAEGFDQIKKAALKATKKEDRDKWAAMYREKFPDMSPEDIETEVAMKALGRRLATPRFLDRYAENRTFMGKLIDTAKQMLEYLRAGKAGRLEMDELSKLIKMMDEAIIKGEVSQNEAKGESGTKRYNIAGQKLVNFINSVNAMQDKNLISKRKHEIGKISDSHANLINKLLKDAGIEIDASGYSIWIDGTHAKHIEDRHGKKGEADQSMASDESKSKIPWAIDTADYGEIIRDENGNIKYSSVYDNSDQTPAPQIRLIKKVGDDTLYVSECVPDSNTKKIFVTSAYIQKGSNVQLLKVDADASPQPTPEAVTGSSATSNSIAQKSEKSTPSAKKSHNIDTEAAEQAAREAAEVEAFRNAQDAEYDRVRQAELEDDITTAAERAIFDAEVSRSETSAKDNNSRWFAWPDVSREVGNIVKEYGIKGTSARYISFAVHRAFNGFRAEVTTAEYCKSFIEHACFPYTYNAHPSICI